MLKPGCLSSDH